MTEGTWIRAGFLSVQPHYRHVVVIDTLRQSTRFTLLVAARWPVDAVCSVRVSSSCATAMLGKSRQRRC
jgi:hypothetical protein